MKKMGLAVVAGLLGAGVATGWAATGSVDAAFMSKYVWRGQIYSDDFVFQPSFSVAAENKLGLTSWNNFELTDVNSTADEDLRGKPTEMDLAVYYGLPLEGLLQVEIGVNQYTYPHPDAASGSTRDAYVEFALDTLLAPTATVFYDFDEVEDFYLSVGVEHEIELTDAIGLTLGASVGYGGADYNAFYFSTAPELGEDSAMLSAGTPADEAGWNDVNGTASLSWQATETVALALTGQYVALMDDAVKKGAKERYGDDSALVGGVSVNWTF